MLQNPVNRCATDTINNTILTIWAEGLKMAALTWEGGMLERPRQAVNRGKVAWSGDNPGIYLKMAPEGDWARLAVYFRIALSPHGRGHAMVVLDRPDLAAGVEAGNLCITDNAAMMAYLMDEFLSKFPSFRGRAGIAALPILGLESLETKGDYGGDFSQIVRGGGSELRMTWRKIGTPFAVEVGPAESATGAHDMYSMFMEAGDGEIAINGRPLQGQVVKRPFFGISMSSAFLAFSETWVTPANNA